MGEPKCNAPGLGIKSSDIRYPGTPGVVKIPYDPSILGTGFNGVSSIIIHGTDPADAGPFDEALVNESGPPCPIGSPEIRLPQTFTFTLAGVSAFTATIDSFDEDPTVPGAGVEIDFGAQAPPPNTTDVAGTVGPCTVFTGKGTCP